MEICKAERLKMTMLFEGFEDTRTRTGKIIKTKNLLKLLDISERLHFMKTRRQYNNKLLLCNCSRFCRT